MESTELPQGSRMEHTTRGEEILRVPHGYFERPRKLAGWRCVFVAYFGMGRVPEARHTYRKIETLGAIRVP